MWTLIFHGITTLRPLVPPRALGGACLLVGGGPAGADDALSPTRPPPPDKSGYHLFDPTPRDRMREMSTDRPDQTESAYTVDAGHLQVELDVVGAAIDRDSASGADLRTEAWGVARANLKLGLLDNVDLQTLVDSHLHSRVEDRKAGTTTEASGFGDLQTRLKINLWGNDGGVTALAIMPFVKWPLPASALRNGRTEGGVIVPFALDLGRGWALGAMTEVDFVPDTTGGYQAEFVNSVTLARDLTADLGMYVEVFTVTGTAPAFAWKGQVDVGWTYAIGADVQLDLGGNFGVTSSAPDFAPFAGLSFRY